VLIPLLQYSIAPTLQLGAKPLSSTMRKDGFDAF
jgi:hypothetical protein